MLRIGTEEVILILKFAKEEHINSLIEGNINVEKIQYYVDLERNSNIVGIGDKVDGCTVITDINITNVEHSDKTPLSEKEKNFFKKVKFLNKECDLHFNLEYHALQDLETPIFCAMCVKKDDLIKDGDEYIFQFTESQIEALNKDFINYTHVFIIDAGTFAKKIHDEAKKRNMNCTMDVIKYYNPDINQAERICDSNNSNIIFWKRDMFKHQKEFRIAFPGTSINTRTDLLNVGKFDEKDYVLFDKDTVLNKGFKFHISKKDL